MSLRSATAAILGLFALLAASCGPQPDRPNVLLISLDALRADHLSSYGYGRETSPFLDELAAKGVRFPHAVVNTLATPQSHTTILSSQYQETHRVFYDDRHDRHSRRVIPENLAMVQEVLALEGYVNLAVTDGGFMVGGLGFQRGFHEYFDGAKGVEGGTGRLLRMIDGHSDGSRPIFAFYHTYEIHSPYLPPENYTTIFGEFRSKIEPTNAYLVIHQRRASEVAEQDLEFLRAMYDGGIRYTDDVLRRFFQKLSDVGFLDNCLIIVTSDHGEGFGEHGYLLHPPYLYDDLLRVPLIVAGTGIEGKVDQRLASSIDIAPTILSYVGAESSMSVQGHDLLAEPLPDGGPPVISQAGSQSYSVRTAEWKLIERSDPPQIELYDLAADPGETANLADSNPSKVTALQHRLETWKAQAPLLEQQSKDTAFTPEQLKRLEDLGYLQTSATEKSDGPQRKVFGYIGTINGYRMPTVEPGSVVTIQGWAADTEYGAPVERVELLIKGKVLATARDFHPRWDVAGKYERDDFAQSGFQVEFSLGDLQPGSYRLAARAHARDGEKGMLSPIFFIIAEPEPEGDPEQKVP